MDVQITTSGLETVSANMLKLAQGCDSASGQALERVALLLLDTVTRYSGGGHPEHPNIRSNTLHSSFQETTISNTEAFVGTQVPYAPYVEYGHMSRSWGSDKWHYVPPYPYFAPALVDVIDSGAGATLYEATLRELLGS